MAWFENVDAAPTERKSTGKNGRSRRFWIGGVLALVAIFGTAGFLVAHSLMSSGSTTTTLPPTTSPFDNPNRAAGPANGIFGNNTIGIVTAKATNGESFTIKTRSGTTVTVKVNDHTVYRSAKGVGSFQTIAIGSRVLVTGSISGSSVNATSVVLFPRGFGRFGGRYRTTVPPAGGPAAGT